LNKVGIYRDLWIDIDEDLIFGWFINIRYSQKLISENNKYFKIFIENLYLDNTKTWDKFLERHFYNRTYFWNNVLLILFFRELVYCWLILKFYKYFIKYFFLLFDLFLSLFFDDNQMWIYLKLKQIFFFLFYDWIFKKLPFWWKKFVKFVKSTFTAKNFGHLIGKILVRIFLGFFFIPDVIWKRSKKLYLKGIIWSSILKAHFKLLRTHGILWYINSWIKYFFLVIYNWSDSIFFTLISKSKFLQWIYIFIYNYIYKKIIVYYLLKIKLFFYKIILFRYSFSYNCQFYFWYIVWYFQTVKWKDLKLILYWFFRNIYRIIKFNIEFYCFVINNRFQRWKLIFGYIFFRLFAFLKKIFLILWIILNVIKFRIMDIPFYTIKFLIFCRTCYRFLRMLKLRWVFNWIKNFFKKLPKRLLKGIKWIWHSRGCFIPFVKSIIKFYKDFYSNFFNAILQDPLIADIFKPFIWFWFQLLKKFLKLIFFFFFYILKILFFLSILFLILFCIDYCFNTVFIEFCITYCLNKICSDFVLLHWNVLLF